MRLHVGDHLLHVLPRGVLHHVDGDGPGTQAAEHFKIRVADGQLSGNLGRHERGMVHEQGVAVRRGVQNGLQRVAGIGPGDGYSQNIFGKQLILCDDFRHLAGDDIVEAAGRIRLDDTDFLRGILGGLRRESP